MDDKIKQFWVYRLSAKQNALKYLIVKKNIGKICEYPSQRR